MRKFTLFALLALSCGQGAPPAGGDSDLPNALVGPFRPLRKPAEGTSAPFLLRGSSTVTWHNPDVLDLDGDEATLGLRVYTQLGDSPSIWSVDYPLGPRDDRNVADAVELLKPTLPWEGAALSHPASIRRGAEVWLYYSAGGCVGLAKSTDGLSFTKQAEPALCGGAGHSLSAPSATSRPSGGVWLVYEDGGKLFDTTSNDGLTFPLGQVPILEPTAPTGDKDEVDQPFDAKEVREPFPLITTGADGRQIMFVYYAGYNRAGLSAIGVAARFDDSGPLTRATAPALTRFEPRSPSVLRHGAITLMVVGGRGTEANPLTQGSILTAVTPATLGLP